MTNTRKAARSSAAKPARAKASLIEKMNQRRLEIWRQWEALDDAQALLREAGTKQAGRRIQRLEARKEALVEEDAQLLEALGDQKPGTAREALVLLDAAKSYADDWQNTRGAIYRMINAAMEVLLPANGINGDGFLPCYCAPST